MLENFNSFYKASKDCQPATTEIINQYKTIIPDDLIEIWQTTGFGKYNDGLIELINPNDFDAVLCTCLGKKVDNYVPIAITAFGELFYYRKLTEEDEDVCMIDIQYRKIETLVWSLRAFFEDFLTNETDRKEWLREDLFKEGLTKLGTLNANEIYTITPALVLGGAPEIDYLQKGNAQVYQEIVFQMTS